MITITLDTKFDLVNLANGFELITDERNKSEQVMETTHERELNTKYLNHNIIEKEIGELWEHILVLENQLKKEIVQNTPPADDETELIRNYAKTIINRFPQIKNMTSKGKFQLKKGMSAKWDIKTLLKLKSRINNLEDYPKWSDVGKDTNLSDYTIAYLCWGIETGQFDKYFKEWEQIQANNFYSKQQPVEIINNPQKRREQGRI